MSNFSLIAATSLAALFTYGMTLNFLDTTINAHQRTANTEMASVGLEKSDGGIAIGDQIWMTENLNVDKFRNGDPIPEAKSDDEWKLAGDRQQPAWCNYDNDPKNGEVMGKLYNWYAVNDPRGLAPAGWRVPNTDDWDILREKLGGHLEADTKLRSKKLWNDGGGNNQSKFNALPNGERSYFGSFTAKGKEAHWWTSTYYDESLSWMYVLDGNRIEPVYTIRPYGCAVRCIKEK